MCKWFGTDQSLLSDDGDGHGSVMLACWPREHLGIESPCADGDTGTNLKFCSGSRIVLYTPRIMLVFVKPAGIPSPWKMLSWK